MENSKNPASAGRPEHLPAVSFHVEQHGGPSREVFSIFLGRGLVELPDCGGAVYGEGLMGSCATSPASFRKRGFQNGKEGLLSESGAPCGTGSADPQGGS